MSYKIGSFNLCDFNEKSKKNFSLLVKIIKKEDFDIVALQEVLSESAINRLKRELGPNWEYSWVSTISWPKKEVDGYAFLWKKNSRKIKLNKTRENTGYSRKNPEILNDYCYNHPRSMIRPPYYASFYTEDNFAEIRILNAHIFRGGNSATEKEQRREEFKLMANNIYTRKSEERNGSNRPVYTIILGDYNLNLKRSRAGSPYVEEELKIKYKGRNETLITIQDQLTTMKRPSDENYEEGKNNRGYSQNYDHCSYGKVRFDGVSITARRIDAVKEYTYDDFEIYGREISDHVPIVVEIDFKPKGR